jgi:hypothetical protein
MKRFTSLFKQTKPEAASCVRTYDVKSKRESASPVAETDGDKSRTVVPKAGDPLKLKP